MLLYTCISEINLQHITTQGVGRADLLKTLPDLNSGIGQVWWKATEPLWPTQESKNCSSSRNKKLMTTWSPLLQELMMHISKCRSSPLSGIPGLSLMAKCSWISSGKWVLIGQNQRPENTQQPQDGDSHKDGRSQRKHSCRQRILLPQKPSIQLDDEITLNGNCCLICKISSF